MLEQVGLVQRGFDAGRAMQIDVPEPPADSAERIDGLLARYEQEALSRADRLVRFAESRTCRHRQVAEHFGRRSPWTAGCATSARRVAVSADAPAAAAPLPEDIAGAIHGAVLRLRWPLGRTGLTAMLRGSISAPRSAQRSPHFGLLAAATQAEIKRWLQLLELAGALESFESDDGFRLLRAVPGAVLPRIGNPAAAGPADEGLFERLRAWRLERARGRGACVRRPPRCDSAQLAAAKPANERDLAAVKGFGPTKLERYGDDVLAVIAAA